MSYGKRSTQPINLRNRLKPFIWTVNTTRMTALIVVIIITAIVEAMIVFTDGTVMTEAKRVNAIYARRRTSVYRDIYQRNRSALRRYIKRNSIWIKAITVFINGIVMTEAKRVNAIYTRKRTAIYRDIY